jgi:hypothetical protein
VKKLYGLLAVVLVCGLLFFGCPQPVLSDRPEVEYIPLEYPLTAPEARPEVPLAPSIIECDTIREGLNWGIWTGGGKVIFGENIIRYKPGSQLCLFLVNDNGEEKTYRLQYMQARKDVVFQDKNDGKGYVDAPLIARQWIWFPSEVTVSDGYVAKIPVVINIPEDASVPETWAFRIGVVLETSDLIELTSTTYFLMKR